MRRVLFSLLLLCVGTWLYAQAPIRFGEREVYLEANVHGGVRGRKTSSLELGIPLGEKLNVLVQFEASKPSQQILAKYGIELGDYVGSNAYYATVKPGSRPSDFVGSGLRSVSPLHAEWKLPVGLLQNTPPEWVQVNEQLQMSLTWFSSVNWEVVQRILVAHGLTYSVPSTFLRSVKVQGNAEALTRLAAEECVAMIAWREPPQELENNIGARLSGARVLRIPTTEYGRALTGKGVRVGVWDANVGDHVDYGKRVHRLEFESAIASSGAHGMHVTGTIAGSGLLDERAKGMASDVEVWTSNFNKNSNQKNEATEMLEVFEQHNISLTSNSYGAQMKSLCRFQHLLTYTLFGKPELDYLAYAVPELTHVFAAGNNQGQCNLIYGSTTKFSKNVITVGAVDSRGKATSFTSYGPLKDGRMYPTVAAFGNNVYSTVDEQTYDEMSGTSMACPMVTGHLALLTQRFKQLNGGALPYNYFLKALIANTATDAGRPGPDYQYGYGIVNAVAAAEVLEHNWYKLDELTDGQTRDFQISVPAGVKELRVMLCWNDPVVMKNYAVGECPLVNDIDLTLTTPNGKNLFPWTLTPALPEENAVQDKKNAYDPLEQVSVSAPDAGDYVVHISGSVKQGDKQPFAIVWYFDTKTPEFTSPLPNEIYEPSEEVFLKTANLTGSLRVELSYDNGNSYSILGKYNNCAKFTLPADAPATNLAMLRVTDEAGGVLQMSAPFSIMPQVKNVRLDDKACTAENWSLVWDVIPSATQYEVLRANVETEKFEVISTVPTPNFALPATAIKDERNIYAVRAISSNGVKGARSKGVLAKASHALVLSKAALPYTEHFIDWPMKYASIATGPNVSAQSTHAYPSLGFPIGANMMLWQGRTREPNWSAPFDKKNNCASVEICQLDLTKIALGTKLHFVVYALTLVSDVENGTMLRLLVDGQEYPDVLNRKQISGDGDEHTYTWDVSRYVGQRINLKLETALQERKNALLVVYYRLMEGDEQKDVLTYGLSKIAPKENMTGETIRFKVKNNSAVQLPSVPFTVRVDDELVFSQVLTDMLPFEDREIKVIHDFSSETARKFNVKVEVDVQDDVNPRNNTKELEVYNLGNVIRMPKTKMVKFLGIMDLPEVPYEKKEVRGVQTFVDNGGHLEGYPADDEAVLQLLPSSPDKLLQVTFKSYDFGKSDQLAIYTGDISDDLAKGIVAATPTTILSGTSTSPKIVLSEAKNGGITFRFVSGSKQLGEGWDAEVREIQMTNQWELVSLAEAEGKDATHRKLVATIKNLTSIPFHQVKLVATLGIKTHTYTIPTLTSNSTTEFIFPDEVDVAPPMSMQVHAQLPKDGDISDNEQTIKIEHDPLWHSGTVRRPSRLYIKQIIPLGEKPINCPTTTAISYDMGKKLTLFSTSKNAFELKLSQAPVRRMLPAKIRAWINLDDNNELVDAAPEGYEINLVEKQESYWLEIDLSKVPDLKLGEHRMRFMVADDGGYAQYKAGNEIEWGQVFDFTAEVKEGVSPLENDIAIVALEGIASGTNLPADAQVKVRLRNNGLAPVGKVKLQYSKDGATPVVQEFAQAIEPHGGEVVVAFDTKADLSRIGRHVFEFLLDSEDADDKNNKLKRSVYHIAPATDKLYSIASNGTKEEYLGLTSIDKDFQENITIEGWWKLDKPQKANLIIAPSIWVASIADVPSLPDNTLYVQIGEKQQLLSAQPVIKPGQWQHIAVTLSKLKGYFGAVSTTVSVYIDGEKITMTSQGRDGFEMPYLLMSRTLKGETAMLRFWNTVRIPADINANKYKSVRNSSGELEQNCVAEFLFTEGQGRATASGTKHFLYMAGQRPSEELWQPIRLVKQVKVAGQVLPAQYTEKDLLEVKIASSITDLTKMKVKFDTDWGNVLISQNATPHTDEREYDFSASDHTLEFVAKRNDLFGKTVEQKVRVKLVSDLSAACDLVNLALNKTDNPRLKEDVELPNPGQNIVCNVANADDAQPIDPKEINITFKELSANAKIFDGTTEVMLNAPYKVDLTKPRTFRVLAQNARDEKFYTIQLGMAQTISWSTTKLTHTFTNAAIALDATVSSGLPISYTSENPAIVTIDADGKLRTSGVGTTFIVASQKGTAPYSAAADVRREVEVTPAALTIKLKDATMEYGSALPKWNFDFEGLLYPNTEYLFDTEYEVLTKDNSVWNESMPPLTLGDYEVRAKDYTDPYRLNNYTVTRTKGMLRVTDAVSAHTFTLHVKDEGGAPLDQVVLQLGKWQLKTNAQGEYTSKLTPGNYRLIAKKEGYTTEQKEFVISDADVTLEVTLAQLRYTLKYHADAHSVILGKTEQKVAAGYDGQAVTAISLAPNYRFKRWTDDNTEKTRHDVNVQADKEVTAEFEEVTYTLTYRVSEGGEFEVGSVPVQTVPYGASGTEVKVKAKAGYIFSGWSDGNKDLARTDASVHGDLEVTALFMKPYLLAWSENFDFGLEKLEDWDVDLPKQGIRWTVHPKSDVPNQPNKGFVVMVDTRKKSALYNGSIYSPWLSLEGRPDQASVVITFKRYQKRGRNSHHTLEYAIDDANWVQAMELGMEMGFDERYELAKEKLVGHKYLRFRWRLNSLSLDEFLAIDDILIKFAPEPTDQEMLTYVAGEHGAIKEVGKDEKTKQLVLKTTKGTPAAEVEAVPDDGYDFAGWSDGHVTATRSDAEYLTVQATFKPKAKAMVTVAYIAQEGRGTIEGSSLQVLEENSSTTIVIARAQKGYRFVKWSDDKIESQRSDIAKATVTYEAQFEPIYTLTYEAGEGGSIRGEATQTVEAGGSGSEVEAVPDNGYRFAKWDDGIMTAKRTETNVQATKTYKAEFEATPTYAVTLKHDGEGELKITGIEESKLNAVPEGTELTAVATPAKGWKLKSLTAGTQDISSDGKFTVTANVEVKAVFEKEGGAPQPTTFAVTLKKEGEGELKVTGIEEAKLNAVPEGTELTAVATPAKGWKLKSLTAGTQDISSDGKFTVTANVEVKAVFEKEGAPQPTTFAVTLKKDGEGELKITGIEEAKLNAVPEGTELTAVATPKTGWKLKSLTAGTQDIKADGKFTVTADVEVKAVFEKSTFVEDAMLANVLVAPNPFDNQLRIVNGELRGTYALLNAQGVVVRSGNMDGNEVMIETTDLPSGLYLLRLTATNGATKVVTVVKE